MTVTIKGIPDPQTGMVINLTELKKIVSPLIEHVDHKNLDLDIDYFKGCPRLFYSIEFSTAENIAIYFWDSIENLLPTNVQLHEIKIQETDKNIAIYRGE